MKSMHNVKTILPGNQRLKHHAEIFPETLLNLVGNMTPISLSSSTSQTTTELIIQYIPTDRKSVV